MNDNAGTQVSGAAYGVAAYALSGGTGNVTVDVAANATITGTSSFGIDAVNLDIGSVSVTTATGDVINSGSSGIDANVEATSILALANSTVHVIANGTINSGANLTPVGTAPAGISAGYFPGAVESPDDHVAGNVIVESNATIIAAGGAGIDAYNWGTGNVTVSTGVTSSITAPVNGIQANALDGGDASVTNDGTVTGAHGIYAAASLAGTVSVTNDGHVTGTSYAGIYVAQNGTGSIGSTTVTNTGTVLGSTADAAIAVYDNATGTVTINNTAGTIGPAVVLASTEAIFESGGDITINNTGEINGTLYLANGTFNNETGGTWQVAGVSKFGEQSTTGVVAAFTIDNAGTIDLIGGASLSDASGLDISNTATIDNLSGSNTISAAITNTGAGTVTVASGSTLNLSGSITGGTVTDYGTIGVTGAATLAGVTFYGAAGGTDTIDNTGTLTLGSGGLTLGGPAAFTLALDGAGTLSLNGHTIKATTAGMTLENDGNTISGAGQIGDGTSTKLTLDNASGIIEALGGTLKIATGNAVTSGGTLEANGATLLVATKILNSGLIEATGGGTLDLQGGSAGEIDWTGGTPVAGSNGIALAGSTDTLLVDAVGGTLQLAGTTANGAVSLGGGTIKGIGTTAETLDNFNNVISGDGHIGLGTDLLTLHNDAAGTIDANVSGQMISIDTVATVNAGTIEATLGGEVNFAGGDITNSGALTASDGSKLAFSNETVVNTGTVNLDGHVAASQIIIHGTLTLESTAGTSTGTGQVILTGDLQNAILSDLHPATLVNVDNTISGSGTIGDADLTVQNDQYGVIDATGVLSLNAGTTTNSGLLEATSGGTLQIEGSISNSGLIEANGGTVFVASTASITGDPSVTITDGGVAEFAGGSSAQTLVLNATFSGAGTLQLDHSQHYGGTITGFGTGDTIDLTDLTYSTSETDVWNSATDTLTIYSGTQSSSLIFSGSYGQNSFALKDAGGDTEVVLSPATASLTGLDNAHNAVDGYAVSATLTDTNASNVTYQWLDNGVAIANATSASYTPTANDLGHALDVVIGFTDGGTTEHVTTLAGTVAAPPAVSFNPTYLTFNGNDYASGPVATTQVGNGANDGVTLAGWVDWNGQSNSGDHGQVLFYNGSTSDAGFGVLGNVTANGLDLQILVGGVTEDDTGVTLSAGQWYDVALTHVNGGYTLYVDGVAEHTFQADANNMPGPASKPDSMLIGGDAGGEGFTGSIGDVSVWNAALTQPQTQQLEFNSLSGGETGLAAYYPLNDGAGTTAADLVNNAGNLSLSGSPAWEVNNSDNWLANGAATSANTPLTLSSLNVSFADAGSDTITVTLDANHGTLSIDSTAGLTSDTGIGSDAVTLTGTLAAIDAALGSGVVYTPTAGYAGGDTLSVSAQDGAFHSSTANVTINVVAPPTITAPESGTTASNFVTMDYPGADQASGTGTFAYGINNSGAIVGGYTIDSQHTSGFEYNGGYSVIGVSGSQDNNAGGINNLGEIAGFNSPVRSTPRLGFTDDGGTYTPIDLPGDGNSGGRSTTANGINDAGVVVGAVYYHGTPIYSGYIDNGGSITYLDAFGTGSSSYYTDAEAINDAGQVVGVATSTYGSNDRGFLYQNGTYTTISDPNGAEGTQAYGINNSGEIVGDYTDSSGKTHGFIDVNGTFTTIDDPLGISTTLTGINDAGQIVGYYEDSGGIYHGFAASLNGVSTPEDRALTLTTLSVSDPAAGTNPIQVTLDAAHGTLTLGDTTNLTFSGQGTDSLILTGTQAAINAALANGLIYAPTLNSQLADVLKITASDQGHNGTGVPLSTTQDVGIVVTAADSIAHGATYTVSAPSGDTIAFADGTGTLDLAQPATFNGEIAGITGSGDVLDIHGFAAGSTTAATGNGSFNSATDTTTLTVTDSSDHPTETFTLAGNLSNSTWTVTDDHNGGVDIVDPPAPTNMAVVPTTVLNQAATSTIVASGPDQILTGNAASDTFAFNFTGVGHATVTDFHPATDTLQFNSQLFADIQAALNAMHDDGHGNTVIALDAHDTITLNGILKAQLHASDFHFV